MTRARANGIEIEYESIGDGEPLLLIMGLGAQLVMWPDELCRGFAERGFRVIRFDNRDIGMSSKLDHLGLPNTKRLLVRALLGLPVRAPYTLFDMADDAVGLLDALGLRDAHAIGVSMGGMIAQVMAIAHQSRVRSLTTIMSGPGNRLSILGKPRAMLTVLRAAPRTREEFVESWLDFFRTCGGSGYPIDEALLRAQTATAWNRQPHPPALARQIAAILATGNRVPALRFVRAPALVLHGADDPLVRPAAARTTAHAIPRARLRVFPGMGHYLPRGLWPELIDEITTHARAACRERNLPLTRSA